MPEHVGWVEKRNPTKLQVMFPEQTEGGFFECFIFGGEFNFKVSELTLLYSLFKL